MDTVLRQRGGTWVGWPGVASNDQTGLTTTINEVSEGARFSLVPVVLDAGEVSGFYNGFSNEVIWPLFHDLFTLCNFQPSYWRAYVSANNKFAGRVAELAQPDDLIWVHDYHLMGIAEVLRGKGVRNRIGFFNHIPFPTPEIFFRLPWRDIILRALLQYDLVGFHTAKDCENFAQCIQQHMLIPEPTMADDEAQVTGQADEWIWDRSRKVQLREFPISIDYGHFHRTANCSEVSRLAAELRDEYGARKIVLGVDRLDYSKGLPNKFAAFQYALEQYPELRGQVTLVQIVVPSREGVPEYQNLHLEIERHVGHINGNLSTAGWIPVHYHYESLDRKELCAYYRVADACLVTSLKDGMNLVAKEYCVAKVDDPGVLILSEFAGAAAELHPHALVVNPYNIEQVAQAIFEACTMDRDQCEERLRSMQEHIKSHDVFQWADSYIEALLADLDDHQPTIADRFLESPPAAHLMTS
jgi:trehalose 6-phosphate synthase